MRKTIGKRLFAGILSATLVMGMVPAGIVEVVEAAEAVETVQESTIDDTAERQTCDIYEWTNVEFQDYYVHSSTIGSYLTTCADGRLMRVQSGQVCNNRKTLVEYYNSDYQLLETIIVPAELPIFGGFYETDSNYFLLTGQNNETESDNVEVFRITKYDKSWNRIASVGIDGGNTIIPFDAGSARMVASGKYLLIRTCHEMYKASDGYNHQANVTIQVDMENMKITDSYTGIMNYTVGYISHSFNQFIKVEDNHIVSVDHGDGLPRSIALLQYDTDISTGSFQTNNCKLTNVMEFPEGPVADNNYTGASLGGFEISDSSYLVAGNAIDMTDEETFLKKRTRNIFVAAVDKNSNEITTNWLTEFEEGDGTTSTPHMVKISDNQYMVLWTRDDMIYYTMINGNGEKTSETYQLIGDLSDCVPVVVDNKLVWYTWDYETIVFYDINLRDLSETNTKTIKNGHVYELSSADGIQANYNCKYCGLPKMVILPTDIYPYWGEVESGEVEIGVYSTAAPTGEYIIGTKLYMDIPRGDGAYPDWASTDVDVIISDPEVVSYTPEHMSDGSSYGYFTMLKAGTAEITVRSKWSKNVEKTYTFIVDDHLHEYEWISTTDGIAAVECAVEGCDFTKTMKVPSTVNLSYNQTGSGWLNPIADNDSLLMDADQTLYYLVSGPNALTDITVADPEIVTFTPETKYKGTFTALKTGKTEVTFRLKYNPTVAKTFTIMVKGDLEMESFTADKVSPQVAGTAITLNAEAFSGDWAHTYKFYETDASGNTTVIQDYSSSAQCIWTPETAGTRTLYAEVMDGEGSTVTRSMEYTVSPATLAVEDFTFIPPAIRTYDGSEKKAVVRENNTITGIGAITVKYYDEEGTLLTGAPVNTGTYTVRIDVAEGTKYTAAADLTAPSWKYTIEKAANAPDMPAVTRSVSHSLKTVEEVSLPENWQWAEADRDNALPAGGRISATAEYIGTDKENYTNTSVSIVMTIQAHFGGTATCISKAVCVYCGEEYGNVNLFRHVGETEVRDASEADCLHDGYTGDTYCCSCGSKLTSGKTIDALGHDFAEYHSNGDATCSADGTKTAVCTRCNAVDTITDLGSKLPHTGGTATCAAQAVCEKCGESYGELDLTNHTGGMEIQNVIAATCASEGYTGDICCRGCGEIVSRGNTIEKLEHEWNEDYTIDREADCANPGRKSIHCKNCQETKDSTVIQPLGHVFLNYVSNGDATCIEDGTKTAFCERCKTAYEKVTDVGSKTGIHKGGTATCTEPAICSMCGESYGEPDTTNHLYKVVCDIEATCTEQGYMMLACTRCGETFHSGFTDATGHDFRLSETVQDVTCEMDGIYIYTCSNCGEEKTETISGWSHEYSEEWVDTKATCQQEGVMVSVCMKCGQSKRRTVSKLEHQYSSIVLEEPTASKQGLRRYACSHCGEYYYEIFRLDGSVVAVVNDPVISIPDADGDGTGDITVSAGDKVSPLKNIISAVNLTTVTKSKKQSLTLKVSQTGNAKLSFSSNNKSVKVDKNGKVTIAKNFAGKVTITIRAASTGTYKAVTKKITLKVNPAAVKISKAVSRKQKLVVKWKKNTKATGYQLQYALDKNFKKSLKTVSIKKNKTVTYQSPKLKKGKTYYIRIRTCKNGCYSTWSKRIKVVI